MKTFGVLYFHDSSSNGDIMNDKPRSSDIYIDQDSKCKHQKDIFQATYDGVSQSLKPCTKSNGSNTLYLTSEDECNIKEKMNITVRGDIKKHMKIDIETYTFYTDNFPTHYYNYNFSTGDGHKLNDRLDIIEQSVNEAVATRNHTKIQELSSKYIYLLFLYINKYGPVARLYIQMADCMALMAQLVHSKPMFDSAINLFDQVMLMSSISDAQFTLVARRQLTFLSLKGNVKSMIDVQTKLVTRFPQNIEELNKLAEIQQLFGRELDAMEVLDRVVNLDSSNNFAMGNLGRMKAANALKKIQSTNIIKNTEFR